MVDNHAESIKTLNQSVERLAEALSYLAEQHQNLLERVDELEAPSTARRGASPGTAEEGEHQAGDRPRER